MPLYQLTKSDIRRCCGTTYYQRGLNYYRSGRVVDFDLVEGDQLVYASVSGSGRRVYEQSIQLFPQRNGRVDIDGTCSCPMSHNCKHVAAALLDVLEYLQFEETHELKASEGQRDDFDIWQQQTLEILQQEQQKYHTTEQPDALLYILKEKKHSNSLICRVVKSRKLKRGGWGKATSYNIHNIGDYWHSTPQWIAPIDDDIAALLLLRSSTIGLDFEIRGDSGLLALQKMVASGRCYWDEIDTPLTMGADRVGEWRWQELESGSKKLIFLLAGQAEGFHLLETDPPYYLDFSRHQCGPIEQPFSSAKLQTLLRLPQVKKNQLSDVSLFLHQNYQHEQLPLPTELAISAAESSPLPKLQLLRTKRADGLPVHIARVTFFYHPIECRPQILQGRSPQSLYVKKEGIQWLVTQDIAAEEKYLDQLSELGLQTAQVGGVFSHELDLLFPGETVADSASNWKNFLDKIPLLEAEGWVVDKDESFALEFVPPGSLTFQLNDNFGDWFEVGLEVEYDNHRFPLLPLLTRWLEQGEDGEQLLVKMPDGRWLCCPESLLSQVCETLVELFDAPQFNSSGQLKLHRSQIYQLSHLEKELTGQGETLFWQGGEELQQLLKKLETFTGLKPVPPPGGLKATLRQYQLQGLSWLQFLREYRFHGILADDMGLGKTIQTLAHLLLEKEAGRLCYPVLIVAPTSVLSIWKTEAERFTPQLRVLVSHGPQRKKQFSSFTGYDLIVTSYALLHRDAKVLQEQKFYALILDEAQAIKNPRSKVAQAAGQISAEFRLCLTGTPVENHLGELWSLFHFLMPGFLGTEKQFRQRFRKPIEQLGDIVCQQGLQQRLLPFILRRDKQQVATELPAKTTMVRSVEMGGDQVRLYESVRSAMSKKVRDLLQKKGIKKSQIEILDALLKLRQVCCDPRLVKLESAGKVKKSAKLEMLLEMVEQLLEEGRKILIFSQFTSMLSLIEAELNSRSISYTKLTGRTIKRDLAISRFQNGEVPLFLISLKAGGVGLNLTAADTVIHYDPWWNPAVENQATDRAYRIGQDKPVFVYKLIVKQTVEEKIIQLQEKKQKLADGVYSTEAPQKMSLLTGDDLLSLFEK